MAGNGPQVVGRFNAHNLLLWAGLPPSETLGKCGKVKIVADLFGPFGTMTVYLGHQRTTTRHERHIHTQRKSDREGYQDYR